MTWAILGTGTLIVSVLIVMVFRLTVTVSRTSTNALASLISFDQRAQQERAAHRQEVRGLVDRLMTGDVESIRVFESGESTGDGGFFAPGEQTEPEDEESPVQVEVPYRGWGNMSPMRERVDAQEAAEDLAAEDDLDGFDRDRQRRHQQAKERGVVS